MSAEQNGPKEDGTGDDVRDGVRDGATPVPKEAPDDEGTTAAAAPSGASDSTDDSARGTGPAEEQDSETPDSRGLTTDTSPGD